MFKLMNKKGFTLIELMIVVAIIGILAAIAIPNFLKYQAKSKQSEAKVNLKGIFTSQTSYFSEGNTYGTFTLINYAPTGNSRYALATGIAAGAAHAVSELGAGTTYVATSNGTTCTTAITTGGQYNMATSNNSGFTAEAWATISNIGYTDMWQVNDNNNLCNTQLGF